MLRAADHLRILELDPVRDHYVGAGGMSDGEFYMTVEDQAAALREAGFLDARALRRDRGMVLHSSASPRVIAWRCREATAVLFTDLADEFPYRPDTT